MRFTLATTCLGGPLVKRLQAAAQAGFDGIEFFWRDCRDSGISMKEIGEITRDLGLRVETLQPIRGYEGDRGSIREASEAAAQQLMEDALELGAPKVGFCANEKEGASGLEETVEEVREVADQAQALGLLLAFEALTWSNQIKDLDQAWEVVKRANRGNLGLVIDSFHIGARGNDPKIIEKIPAAKLSMLQISNTTRAPDLPWIEISRHHRSLPDEGYFPVAEIVAASLDAGYSGSLTIEIFNDVFRQSDAFVIAKQCRDSLERVVQSYKTRAPHKGQNGG